jgi:polyphosphate kinase 2 (PPK2 family)
MLEKVDLRQSFPKEELKSELPALRQRLADLTKAAHDRGIPSLVLFEGWECAGKGAAIQLLTERLDARGFKVYPIGEPTTEEQRRPWLYRYWVRLPKRGVMAIFDRSWYGRVLGDAFERRVTRRQVERAYVEICDFERALVEDGAVVVKFWMHISRKEQAARIKKLAKDPVQRFLVTEEDREENRRYGEVLGVANRALRQTHTKHAPWTVVEANDRHFAFRKVYTTLIDAYDRATIGRSEP